MISLNLSPDDATDRLDSTKPQERAFKTSEIRKMMMAFSFQYQQLKGGSPVECAASDVNPSI